MGCGMALPPGRRSRKVVAFLTRASRNYYDDVDYGIRLWRAGLPGRGRRRRVGRPRRRGHAHSQAARSATALRRAALHSSVSAGGGVPALRAPPRAGSCSSTPGRASCAPGGATSSARRGEPRGRCGCESCGALALERAVICRARARLPAGPCRRPARAGAAGRGLVGRRLPGGCAAARAPTARSSPASASTSSGQAADGLLPYGWFPPEDSDGRSYRWATTRAAVLVCLQAAGEAPAPRLQARPGRPRRGRGRAIGSLGNADPAEAVWRARLGLAIHRSLGREPPAGAPAGGTTNSLFSAIRGWSHPPAETRSLALALASVAFLERVELPRGGLDMDHPGAEGQLVSGWSKQSRARGAATAGRERKRRRW